MEVGGEGAGGQPAKKQLNETELVNRHSFGGDARSLQQRQEHGSFLLETHTITCQPTETRTISAGRVK